MTTNLVQKSSAAFVCECCDYYTSRKSQYERHLSTPKHQNTINTTNLVPKSSEKFVCEKCNFIGKNPLALSVHKRTCDKTNLSVQENNIVSPITVQLQQHVPVPVPIPQPIHVTQPVPQKLTKIITKTVVTPQQNK